MNGSANSAVNSATIRRIPWMPGLLTRIRNRAVMREGDANSNMGEVIQ